MDIPSTDDSSKGSALMWSKKCDSLPREVQSLKDYFLKKIQEIIACFCADGKNPAESNNLV